LETGTGRKELEEVFQPEEKVAKPSARHGNYAAIGLTGRA
jgi:hypothetical protein